MHSEYIYKKSAREVNANNSGEQSVFKKEEGCVDLIARIRLLTVKYLALSGRL